MSLPLRSSDKHFICKEKCCTVIVLIPCILLQKSGLLLHPYQADIKLHSCSKIIKTLEMNPLYTVKLGYNVIKGTEYFVSL